MLKRKLCNFAHLDPNPDPAQQINEDLWGSGSTIQHISKMFTLQKSSQNVDFGSEVFNDLATFHCTIWNNWSNIFENFGGTSRCSEKFISLIAKKNISGISHKQTLSSSKRRGKRNVIEFWKMTDHRVPTVPPSSTCSSRAYRNHLNEEITPLLPTGIGEQYCQTISNLGHAALLRLCGLQNKRKYWTDLGGGPLVNSLLWGTDTHINRLSQFIWPPDNGLQDQWSSGQRKSHAGRLLTFLRTGRKLRTGRWPPAGKILCKSVLTRTGRKLRTGRWPPVGKILSESVVPRTGRKLKTVRWPPVGRYSVNQLFPALVENWKKNW